MAGLPGTGLGGIFYVLLVLWVVMRESWRLARGVSHPARWTRIGGLMGLSGAIVLALWAEGWAIQQALDAWVAHGTAAAPAFAVIPFATLAALLLAVHALRLLRRRVLRAEPRPERLPEPSRLAPGHARNPVPVRS